MAVRPEDLARALVRRRQEAAQAETRRASRLRAELEAALREARPATGFHRAWLVGSLARGGFGSGSDVDVVVEGASEEEAGRLWGALARRLDAPLDLMRLESLEPSFRARVLEEGVPLV